MEARLLLGAIWMATILGLQGYQQQIVDIKNTTCVTLLGLQYYQTGEVSVTAADDNSSPNDEDLAHEPEPLPYSFITQPQRELAKEGEDVVFKCELEGTPGLVLWMNDTTPVFMGRNPTYPNPRLSVEGDGHAYNLRIKEVTLMDEGDWTCQVPGLRTIEQTNKLIIVIDPSITATPEDGSIDVIENEAVKLSCEADGKPDPNVTWSKEGDEHFKEDGFELSFGAIKRDNSGTYICTATNGVGEAAIESFEVEVMFAPTVEVLEEVVHTGPNDEVSLTCDFTSNPPVDIIWQHNGQDINLEEGGNFHATTTDSDDDDFMVTSILTIKEMQATDLGEYTCIGGNGKGEPAKGTITLSGEPYQLEVISDVDGDYSDVFILEWEFFSVADPTECVLKVTEDGEEFGENVVPSRIGENSRHQQVYRIEGLTRDTQYAAKLNCKNAFGETGFSEEFHFNTSKDENPAPLPTTTLEPEPELETTPTPKATTQKAPVETTEGPKDTTTTLDSTSVAMTTEDDLTTTVAVTTKAVVLTTEAVALTTEAQVDSLALTLSGTTIGSPTSSLQGTTVIESRDKEEVPSPSPSAEEDVTTIEAIDAIDTDDDDDDKENDQDKDDDNDEDDKEDEENHDNDDDHDDHEDFEELDNESDRKPPEANNVAGAATDVRSCSLLSLTFLALCLLLRQ